MLDGNLVVLFWKAGPVPSVVIMFLLSDHQMAIRCSDDSCLILLASLEIEELWNLLGTTGLNEDKI